MVLIVRRSRFVAVAAAAAGRGANNNLVNGIDFVSVRESLQLKASHGLQQDKRRVNSGDFSVSPGRGS